MTEQQEPQQPAVETPVAPEPPATPTAQGNSARLPGIPHNLGLHRAANSQLPHDSAVTTRSDTTAAAQETVASETATHENSAQQEVTQSSAPAAPPVAPALATSDTAVETPAKSSQKDKIATIVLLVVGALSAINLALSMASLYTTAHLLVATLPKHNLTVPEFVQPLGAVMCILMLLSWLLTLAFAVNRLRAKKRAFWVPLVAGVITTTISLVVSGLVIMQTLPADVLSDPQQMQIIVDALSSYEAE